MSQALTDILTNLQDKAGGESVCFADLIEGLDYRGFGVLLAIPALLIILPTGAIPGVPAFCALIMILISSQIIIGRKHLWLPEKLRNINLDREKFDQAMDKITPYTKRIDRWFQPRLQFLTGFIARMAVAVISMILSLFIIVLGFIPFAPLLPAFIILLFGLALSVNDGILTAIGLVVLIGAAIGGAMLLL